MAGTGLIVKKHNFNRSIWMDDRILLLPLLDDHITRLLPPNSFMPGKLKH
jgi:hypothetical protein